MRELKKEDYAVGKRPPGLDVDGSFLIAPGLRGREYVDDEGRKLVVDRTTKVLVEEKTFRH